MKKVSTVVAKQRRNLSRQQQLTIGLDLGDRSSYYCVLDESGAVISEQKITTSAKALGAALGAMPHLDMPSTTPTGTGQGRNENSKGQLS